MSHAHRVNLILLLSVVGGAWAADEDPDTVPGFGEVETTLGFGDPAAPLEELYDGGIMKTVDDVFSKYDADNNGVLEGPEMRAVPWRDDPLRDDTNGDGRLTKLEYAERTVRRAGGRGRIDPGQRQDRSRPEPQNRDPAKDRAEAQRLLGFYTSLDANKDGTLHPDEFARNPLRSTIERRIKEAGLDPRKPVRLESFVKARLKNAGIDASKLKKSERQKTRVVRAREERPPRKKSRSPKLSGDVAEWFAARDTNRDGQIQMAEFASSWSDSLANEFIALDIDGNGILSPTECGEAKSSSPRVASRSSNRGSRYSRDRARSEEKPAPPKDDQVAKADAKPPEAGDEPEKEDLSAERTGDPLAAASETDKPEPPTGVIPKVYMDYAKGVIAKYDADEDGVLVASEWGEMSGSPASADYDGDGELTAEEYARSKMPK